MNKTKKLLLKVETIQIERDYARFPEGVMYLMCLGLGMNINRVFCLSNPRAVYYKRITLAVRSYMMMIFNASN